MKKGDSGTYEKIITTQLTGGGSKALTPASMVGVIAKSREKRNETCY